MIRIFNSATFRFDNSERFIPLEEVNVVSMKMDYNGAPYLLFEHKAVSYTHLTLPTICSV